MQEHPSADLVPLRSSRTTRAWEALVYPVPPLSHWGTARKVAFWTATVWLAMVAVTVVGTAWNPLPVGPATYDVAAGFLGLLWVPLAFITGRYAHRVPVRTTLYGDAGARLRARDAARALCAAEPELATALGIGRPDLPRDVDDGGLVDVNHVPAVTLRAGLGLSQATADAIVATRDAVGGFSSTGDLRTYVDLTQVELDDVADRMLFRTGS
jgi:hypothetical protein